ncbi:putative protein phosphatase 2C 8 [Tetrabaena socialis]|uniref:PPM-type phosphatase domain-containing protein n=1 Tax=Tetrabaena socialis TaxID=47790 RepID=A0A2J7ZLX7_9CHLO|nr:putative protein phosphatase 2C 8 [Tetrabaena socialis]|eukprot:PNH01260.1 putative protein phosphatase 2C 8 [Tetrabaena socialis]
MLPVWSVASVQGRRRTMEDAYSIHVGLPGLPHACPHFFGVFDGHRGDQVAQCCATRLPLNLVDELSKGESSSIPTSLTSAFHATDAELGPCGRETGSTAVVALLGDADVYIAHCGDSRAIVSKGGTAHQLSDDHRPARDDEMSRIKEAGGFCCNFGRGNMYVMGQLAVTRSFGDFDLRPYVIAQPELVVHARTPDDEFLVLASDGLWDALSNQEVVNIIRRCLARAKDRGQQDGLDITAKVLVKMAIRHGSTDNVTAIIVLL